MPLSPIWKCPLMYSNPGLKETKTLLCETCIKEFFEFKTENFKLRDLFTKVIFKAFCLHKATIIPIWALQVKQLPCLH